MSKNKYTALSKDEEKLLSLLEMSKYMTKKEITREQLEDGMKKLNLELTDNLKERINARLPELKL